MQIADEKAKAPHGTWLTSGEVCGYLNIKPRTFRLRLQTGKIPPAAVRTEHGWGLWSLEQVNDMLRQELERRKP